MGLPLFIEMAQSVHHRMIALALAGLMTLPSSPALAQGISARPMQPTLWASNAGVDSLPAMGEASSEDLSAAEERRLGAEIFQEFMRAGVVFEDPEAQDYLAVQSSRLLLAAQSQGQLAGSAVEPQGFRFFLVDDAGINAFALPGGYIGVHTGLVVLVASESELMSVLAHEIGHVAQRHIARMFGQSRQSTALTIASLILAALAASQSGQAATGVLSLGQTLAVRDQMAFSRDAEREADRVGLNILLGAGFDGRGMTGLFERLDQTSRFVDQNVALGWLRTHPLTTERINDVSLRLGQLSTAQIRPKGPDSVEFGWIQIRLNAQARRTQDQLQQGRGLFSERLTQAKTDADRARLAYGLAWIELGDRQFDAAQARAAEAARYAEAAGQGSVAAPMLLGFSQSRARKMGRASEAVGFARQMLTDYPRALSSRAVIRQGMEAALESGQTDDLRWAQAQGRALTRQWPEDRIVWQLLSRLSDRLGQRAAAHAAAGEAYAIAGAWKAAMEQFEFARKAGDGDFVLLSQVDVRMAKIRAEIARLSLEKNR